MAGVSVSRRSQGDAWVLLAQAADPEGTAKRLDELKKATTAYNKAAVRHGKANEIDAVLAEAKQNKEDATDVLSKAKGRAKEIVATANAEADSIVSEAKQAAATERKNIKAAQDRLRARETRVKEKEENIEPRWTAAHKAEKDAEAREAEAERTKRNLEGRIRVMKEALRQAEK